MDFEISGETIIICENIYKKRLLNKFNDMKEMYPIHFITMQEFIKKCTYDYDYKAILYLMEKYSYKYEVAKMYIDNTYYIENKQYKSEKLEKLRAIKNELEENNLLIYDEYYKKYLEDKDIIIYKYDMNNYEEAILSNFKNVKIISKKFNKYDHIVYEFEKIEDEVDYVCRSICKLIVSGVDINKIKLANITSEYINIIKRYFDMYNIPINMPSSASIYSSIVAQEFLNNLDDDIEKAIESISKYKKTSIYEKIVDLCNRYVNCDNPLFYKRLLTYDIKHTYFDEPLYKNAIEIIDYKDNDISDEYVFLLGFNIGNIPITYMDEDYIGDNIKDEVDLTLTVNKNKFEKEISMNSILNIKNLTITYKLSDSVNTYYPSNLVSNFEVKKVSIDSKTSYSILNDKIKFTDGLDNLLKYNVNSNDLSLLYNNYDIPYLSYDNKYKGISKESLHDYLNNKLTLSYSSMNIYNECAFRYYLSYILKLNLYEETFMTLIGNIYHHILEIGISKDIDVDAEINSYIKDRKFTKKEAFYIEKLRENVKITLTMIKEKMQYSKLDSILTEKEVVIDKSRNNIDIKFKGFIDKLIYKKVNDDIVIAVIDYKTGNPDINLKYAKDGLNLQLPIYLYLIKNSDLKNIKFAGFYLQKVMFPNFNIDKKMSLLDQRKDYLKLEGYTNKSIDTLELLDITYKDSALIKSLKQKNDGNFYAYSKVLNNSQLDKLYELMDNIIEADINNILDAKFDINPKKDGYDLIGCSYCPYHDICYKTKNDEALIFPDDKLSFLGGDEDE